MDKEKTPPDGQPDTQDKKGEGDKTFTQEQLDNIVNRRLAEEKAKFSTELKGQIELERKEAERMAKLSAEEKEKEMLAKQAEATAKKEQELALRENKLLAGEKLSELKMPTKLVTLVATKDEAETLANIESLHKVWADAVAEEVKVQLKGNPPADFSETSKAKNNSKVLTTL